MKIESNKNKGNTYQSIQGNMGLGKAISYFTSLGYSVALPLNDTQKYDIIVDFNGGLQRVSVKTSRYSRKGDNLTFEVGLKNSGGSRGKGIIRNFDNTTCDYVFIYTADESLYLIPALEITAVSTITVGNKWTEYKVKRKELSELE